ncbi:MAG: M48 family metalloprotease, partial [Thermodesulfobacteriota bacterium]|nr:M48 family metalloprotease [Thermodesulfobacteriota bacterium]
ALGQKFLNKVRKYFDMVDDEYADEFINNLGQYLIRPLETKHFPFHFYIINDNNLNAFAAPGGHIFIYSGLIRVMDEIDELAAVICHEIGHVSARHLSHRIEQNKKIGLATMAGVLAGILIGGKAAGAIMTGTMAAGIQAQLQYSRNDERQADQLGFKYMVKAGYNPSGMTTTLRKINEGQWFSTDKIPPYLLTHPSGPERMANLDMMMTHYTGRPENKQAATFRSFFPFFKTLLMAKYNEPREAERLFKKELETKPDSVLAHFGLGVVMMEISEYDQAIDHFQKALKGKQESLYILRYLGEAYQLEGRDDRAIKVLKKALELDSQERSAMFLLAMSYLNTEEYSKAISLFESLTHIKPVKDEVFYNLGISYGRQERLALAHYNFGIYFKRQGNMRKARFHFQKARDLSHNDPALSNRIHKAMEEER